MRFAKTKKRGRHKTCPVPLSVLTSIPIARGARLFVAPHEPEGTAIADHPDLLPVIPLGVTVSKRQQRALEVSPSVGIGVGGEIGTPVFRPSEPNDMTLWRHTPVLVHAPRGEEGTF